MIEVSKVHYDVIAITEKKVQLNITQAVEGLGWEEEEDELAMKITFELYNAKYNGSRLSSLIKIGCVVAIKAYWGSGKGIVAMGNVTECERSTTKADEVFNVVAYDNLYSMQRSQDNIYFAAGKGTKSALTEVFKNWGITLSSYSGPDVSHAKILYKNSYLGDVVRGILDEAKKKGGGKAIVRSTQNKVSIVAVGGNKDIYHFEGNNSVSSKHKVSIANLVTRVKIVSSEKTDGLPKVEAVKNGKTEYGIFQRIVNHASSDNLSEAQETAQEKLDKIEKENTSRERSKLRDRLLQSHRYFTNPDKNPMQAWSEMEADAFWSMFKEYENVNGDGHMHTTVQPEMRALEVIPMHEDAKIAELMGSRK